MKVKIIIFFSWAMSTDPFCTCLGSILSKGKERNIVQALSLGYNLFLPVMLKIIQQFYLEKISNNSYDFKSFSHLYITLNVK